MKILVTGGAGFLGSVLVPRLSEEHDVFIYDKYLYGQEISKYNVDILPDDIDVVIHLASVVGDEACDIDREFTNINNILSTKEIFDKYKGKKIIFASTCSVYGHSNGDIATTDSELNPLSYYARTKIVSEQILEDKAVILRFGTLFGASPRMRYDLVLNTMTINAIKTGELQLFGGNQWRPLLAVQDASKVIENAIDMDNGVYNVGGKNYQIKDLVDAIKAKLPDTIVKIKECTDSRDYLVDTILQPTVSIEQGIEDIIDVSQGVDYNHYRYYNVRREECRILQ